MATRTRSQKIYDHRLKDLVRETGDIQLAVQRGVPRSTAQDWLCPSSREVVTLDVHDATETAKSRRDRVKEYFNSIQDTTVVQRILARLSE